MVTRKATFTCAHVGGKPEWNSASWKSRVCVWGKSLFPHQPKPHLARCSFRRVFPARCPLSLHSGFWSRGMASRSRVLAKQSTETFHQSADGDGSSRIIRAAKPAGIRLYSPHSTKASTYTLYTHSYWKPHWVLNVPGVYSIMCMHLISAHADVKYKINAIWCIHKNK